MTEPRYVYITTAYDPKFTGSCGGIGGEKSRTFMFLNPTSAITDGFIEQEGLIGPDEEIHVYQVDLQELDGMWPRVNAYQFNAYALKWSCSYLGKIPSTALTWINSITKDRFEMLNRVEP